MVGSPIRQFTSFQRAVCLRFQNFIAPQENWQTNTLTLANANLQGDHTPHNGKQRPLIQASRFTWTHAMAEQPTTYCCCSSSQVGTRASPCAWTQNLHRFLHPFIGGAMH
eukprot:scaffold256248_cov24-Tisochrysis_lutea.AAC.2